jgi:hypothetical protein
MGVENDVVLKMARAQRAKSRVASYSSRRSPRKARCPPRNNGFISFQVTTAAWNQVYNAN